MRDPSCFWVHFYLNFYLSSLPQFWTKPDRNNGLTCFVPLCLSVIGMERRFSLDAIRSSLIFSFGNRVAIRLPLICILYFRAVISNLPFEITIEFLNFHFIEIYPRFNRYLSEFKFIYLTKSYSDSHIKLKIHNPSISFEDV